MLSPRHLPFYTRFSFLIPKHKRSIPDKNLGFLITTTFIRLPPYLLVQHSPKKIIIIASKNITVPLEQIEATMSPKPNATANEPLGILLLYIKAPPSFTFIVWMAVFFCVCPQKLFFYDLNSFGFIILKGRNCRFVYPLTGC